MTLADGKLLDRMTRVIVDEVNPAWVIRIRSRSRGRQRENSDVELVAAKAEPCVLDHALREGEVRNTHRVLAVSEKIT